MYKRILLAYDGTDAGQKALLDCRELAQWSQSELHLVAVMPSAMSFVGLEGGVYDVELEERDVRVVGAHQLFIAAPVSDATADTHTSDARDAMQRRGDCFRETLAARRIKIRTGPEQHHVKDHVSASSCSDSAGHALAVQAAR